MSHFDRVWRDRYNSLIRFRRLYPEKWPDSRSDTGRERALAAWCSRQRGQRKKGVLRLEFVLLLDDIEFPWAPTLAEWNRQYSVLLQFRGANPTRWPLAKETFPAGNQLGIWCDKQRRVFKSGRLDSEKVVLLNQIGFPWNVLDANWQSQYEALVTYRARNLQTWPIGTEEFPPGNNLALWCDTQRRAFKRGELDESKAVLLGRIGFPWEKDKDESWNRQLRALVEYRKKFHNKWPSAGEEFPRGNPLGSWCHVQRKAFKLSRLSGYRRNALADLGFPWELRKRVSASSSD